MSIQGGVSKAARPAETLRPLDTVTMKGSGLPSSMQAIRTKYADGWRWSLTGYTEMRRSGGDRHATWAPSQEDAAASSSIALNCSGGRVHAWKGKEAPSYVVHSPTVANKERRDDLVGYISTSTRVPKGADMGTYGQVKEVTLAIDPNP